MNGGFFSSIIYIFDIRKIVREGNIFQPKVYHQVLQSDIAKCECEHISHNGQLLT
jgi:hypothetical protein